MALLIPLLFAAAVAQPRIGTITIRTLDVFSESEASRGLFYRAANRLHVETRPQVIRRFLTFREGDVYDPERLEETERNLRALHYIKSASVTASEPHNGVVDVTVTTQDAWSIAPETQAGKHGGENTYGASISETNLFGTGKEVSVNWDKTVDRTRLGVDYQDPMLFPGYWMARATYGSNSDGDDRRLTLRRPFYSFTTPWAAEMTFIGFRQNDRLFAGGRTSAKFQQDHRLALVSYGRALSATDELAARLTAGIRLERDDFNHIVSHPLVRLPDHRDFHYVFVRYDRVANEFLKLNFVNKDIRYEDFNLGAQTSFEAAVSPGATGSDRTTGFARVTGANGWRFAEQSFVIPRVSIESRLDRGARNTILSTSTMFVRKRGDEHPSTLVGRAVVNAGWRLDGERQFFADGITGLRGYRIHSFAGTRSVVFNLEQRWHLGREVLQLASPAIVAFIDSGNATNGGLGDLMHLKTDAGVGIRIGLPRTPKNLLRLDFAYAFNKDGPGRRGLMISFSSGQAF